MQSFWPPLVDPQTHTPLTETEGFFTGENKKYPIVRGVPCFNTVELESIAPEKEARWGGFKKYLKYLLPPHHSIYLESLKPSLGEGRELKHFLKDKASIHILNIGSCSLELRKIHPFIVRLSPRYQDEVEIVADPEALPFADETWDMVICRHVIEHSENPRTIMQEIHRVLKKGGYLYMKFPFLQPLHKPNGDFRRYTPAGFEELAKSFTKIDQGVAVGPASMMCRMLREWLAVFTSFGNERAYKVGLFFWGWMTFWICYLDYFFRKNPQSYRVASAFYAVYQK